MIYCKLKFELKLYSVLVFFSFALVLGVVRAAESLDEVKSKAGLDCPERISATNLRKYTATIAQVNASNFFSLYLKMEKHWYLKLLGGFNKTSCYVSPCVCIGNL